jgi:hypothetical protein
LYIHLCYAMLKVASERKLPWPDKMPIKRNTAKVETTQ